MGPSKTIQTVAIQMGIAATAGLVTQASSLPVARPPASNAPSLGQASGPSLGGIGTLSAYASRHRATSSQRRPAFCEAGGLATCTRDACVTTSLNTNPAWPSRASSVQDSQEIRPAREARALSSGRLVACVVAAGPEEEETRRLLRELQEKVERQSETIEKLQRKVSELEATQSQSAPGSPSSEPPAAGGAEASSPPARFGFGNVRIAGEGGLGFFNSQSQGMFPNAEFRVDEAKIFLETPILKDVYFFSELDVFSREKANMNLRPGELYLDFESLSGLWGRERDLNLRAGRFDIPFGLEYQSRDAINNPLISHSIMDFWGVDEGVEAYGTVSGLDYVVAVQNGGHDGLRDFNADKAVIAGMGGQVLPWLRLSASAMRTGELDVDQDEESELWLGSGFIRSLGSAATSDFEGDVLQGDIEVKFERSRFHAAGGVLRYDDDDPAADNGREVYFYFVEAEQRIYQGFYAAARWSQVFADEGFPIVGNGDRDLFYETFLTEDLWRLSLGLGYRWSPGLVWKAEYSFERGHLLGGSSRDQQDMVSTVVAFGF